MPKPLLEPVEAVGTRVTAGHLARFWLGQPKLHIADDHPHLCVARAGAVRGFDLLRAMLIYETTHFPLPADAPTFILLPEFSVNPADLPEARKLMRDARPNTVFVFGVGDLTEAEALAIEPEAGLWGTPAEGRLTNCAVVGFGGSDVIRLQPKIVPSRWEPRLWPGTIVRYFVGDSIQFTVVICSDLIDQPADQTVAARIAQDLKKDGRTLSLAIWLQHTPNPRSRDFVRSIERFRRTRTTTLVVSSREERPGRRENYAVSGAILPLDSLAREFDLLTAPFHYVEPILETAEPLARAVLLRYDADVYRVESALAEDVDSDDRTEKGAILRVAQPYLFAGDAIAPSTESIHLYDIVGNATAAAEGETPALVAGIDQIRSRIVDLGTRRFQQLLDVALIPTPENEADRHIAGTRHGTNDLLCRCWPHRKCIDDMAHDEGSRSLLRDLIQMAAALLAADVAFHFEIANRKRTNARIDIDGRRIALGLAHARGRDAVVARTALCGREEAATSFPYVIAGTGGAHVRPLAKSVDPSRAARAGSIDPSVAVVPIPMAVYSDEFWAAHDAHQLGALLRQRFLMNTA